MKTGRMSECKVSCIKIFGSIHSLRETICLNHSLVPTPMVTVMSDPLNPRVGDSVTLTCTIVPVDEPAVDTAVMVTAVWTGPEGPLTGTDPTMVSAGTYESTLTLTTLSNAGAYTCTANVSPDGTSFVTASVMSSDFVTAGESNEFAHVNPHNTYCIISLQASESP